MTLGELDMAVRVDAPLLVVCLNDRAYGSELYHLREMGLPVDNALFATPDLAKVAAALGMDALQVTEFAQLDELPDRLASARGPVFVDCLSTREAVPTPLRDHI